MNALLILLAIIAVLSWVSLWLISTFKQSESQIKADSIQSIEVANDNFLPIYLGYFFVALGVDSFQSFVFIFLIIGVFTYFSRVSYFNPIFLIFGYKYYSFSRTNGIKQLFITKVDILDKTYFDGEGYKQINKFTFIKV